MYAIIKTGGKQYRVKKGDLIDVELLSTNEPGTKIHFKEVLFFDNGTDSKIGAPILHDISVGAEVVGEVKGEKVVGLKYKPSHNSRRKWGHRQNYTRVKITSIGDVKHGGHHGS